MKTDPWLTDRLRGDAVLVKAERKIEAAVLAAMTQWMSAAKAAMFGQPITLTADAQFTVDVDAAQASFAVWTQGIAEHIEPAITEAFGASFAGAMRTADVSVLPYQEAHMQDVFDRLKIWPEGAFEDMRPELVQAVSRASTIAEAQDQVAGILDINAPTRRLRQQITDVDAELAALDVGDSREGALRATRRRLWEEHDRSLGEWQYLARRIARTEVQGAVEGGALASAQATAAATGERMYKQWLCVTGDMPVSAVGVLDAARRHYKGTLVTIRTVEGARVSLTPEHGVLTGRGWIAAQDVRQGDNLCRVVDVDSSRAPHVEDAPTLIGDVVDAAMKSEPVEVWAVSVGVDLYGDAARQGDVEVVSAEGDLSAWFESGAGEGLRKLSFADADVLGEVLFFGGGAGERVDVGYSASGVGGDKGAGSVCGDCGGFVTGADDSGGGPVADRDTGALQYLAGGVATAPVRTAQCADGIAAQVVADEVVTVDVRPFDGHVYDLSTQGGWYLCDSLIIHNSTHDSRCRKTHQVADGQIVGIEGKFTVGRSTLEHPADPRGQDKETINCRCTLLILDEAEVQEKLRGKWGGRGVQPMSHRMGPDDPAEIDNAVELATREAKGEVVDWPKRNDPPDYPNPAVPDPTPPTPPTPAQTLAESVDDDLPIAEVLSENAAPAARRRSEFSGLSLDQLTEEMTASIDVEDFDRMDRFAAEIDRREAANLRAREKRERNRSAKERAQSAKYDELLAAGVDDEEAIEQAFGIGVVQQRRMNAISTLRGWGYQGRSLDDLFKAWHRGEAHDEYLRAEEATRTHMLKSRYEGKMDARSLWFRNEATARKYASDELLEYWDQHGRVTVEELKARLMDPTELLRLQASRTDYLQ